MVRLTLRACLALTVGGCASLNARLEDADSRPLFSLSVPGARSLGSITQLGLVAHGDSKCWIVGRARAAILSAGTRCELFDGAAAMADDRGHHATGLRTPWVEARDERLLDANVAKDRVLVLSGRLPTSSDAAVRARLSAIEASGKRAWELPFLPFDLESAPTRGALLTSRASLFVALDERVARIDPKQGSLDWHRKIPGAPSKEAGRFVDGGSLGVLFVEGDRVTSIAEGGIAWQRTPRAGAVIEDVLVAGDRWLLDIRAGEERIITSLSISGDSEWSIIRGDPEPRVTGLAVLGDRAMLAAGARLVAIDLVKGSALVLDRFEPGAYGKLVAQSRLAALVGPKRIEGRSSEGKLEYAIDLAEGWSEFAPPSNSTTPRFASARSGEDLVLIDLERGVGVELETDEVQSGCEATIAVDPNGTWLAELLVGSCKDSSTIRAFEISLPKS
ncbi:MAG: PQQ-binding-like beta-propeller repeat protein [Deltaproteobacteria bacterium]|nr:PQQ-binding-like beta-propeller repeat protein [Deltaproteobacteria bacterium]